VDHIAPAYKHVAEFYNPNNLRAICKRCHRAKTMQESKASRGIIDKPDYVV